MNKKNNQGGKTVRGNDADDDTEKAQQNHNKLNKAEVG